MTREDYIKALKSALQTLPASDVSDICGDFEEHFSIGLSQGKTEHEISAELGDPSDVAATYFDEDLANIGHTMSESAVHAAGAAATASGANSANSTNRTTASVSAPAYAATAAGVSGAALSAGQPAGTASASAPAAAKEKDLTGARLFVVLLNVLITWWVAITIVSTLLSFWGVTISLFVGGIGAFIAIAGQSGDWMTILVLCGVGAILMGIASGIVNFFLCKWTVIGTKAYIKWNKKVYNEGF